MVSPPLWIKSCLKKKLMDVSVLPRTPRVADALPMSAGWWTTSWATIELRQRSTTKLDKITSIVHIQKNTQRHAWRYGPTDTSKAGQNDGQSNTPHRSFAES
jgi:hypothetical protein